MISPIVKRKNNEMNRVVQRLFIPNGVWYDYSTGKKFLGNIKTEYVKVLLKKLQNKKSDFSKHLPTSFSVFFQGFHEWCQVSPTIFLAAFVSQDI